MGLMLVEYLMERRSRLEEISKQSGWGNSPPNLTDGKLMHVYFYRNYIFLKPDIHLNKVNIKIDVVDVFDYITIMLTSKITLDIITANKQHELNTNIARLWGLL